MSPRPLPPCPPLQVVQHALGVRLAVELQDWPRLHVELAATRAALAAVEHDAPATAGVTTEQGASPCSDH